MLVSHWVRPEQLLSQQGVQGWYVLRCWCLPDLGHWYQQEDHHGMAAASHFLQQVL
jgi:hypothetical protein